MSILAIAVASGLLSGCMHEILRAAPRQVTLPLDQSVALTASLTDHKAAPLKTGLVTWEARNQGEHRLARISPQGVFTARLPGVYRISAKAGQLKGRAMVYVLDGITRDPSAPPIQVTSVSSFASGGGNPPPLRTPAISGPGWQDGNFRRAFFAENRLGHDVQQSQISRPKANPRNLPGPGRLNVYDQNFATVTSGQNYVLAVPVLSLPGRGRDLSLTMFYNAKLWTKVDAQRIVYDHDHGWPAPGWSLGLGKVLRMGSYGVALEDRDGTLHPFGGTVKTFPNGYDEFIDHTVDGTLINCAFQLFQGGLQKGSVRYPDGTSVDYGSPSDEGNVIYPTLITDANGNYLTITYVNNVGPRISNIIDTLGRSIEFHYDPNGLLSAVSAPALGTGDRILVELHYRQQPIQPAFATNLTAIAPSNPWSLDAIYFPATSTGYWFGDPDSYSSYGMIAKVSQRRGMWFQQGTAGNTGLVTLQKTYNYPLRPDPTLTDAPNYTQMVMTWAGMDSPPATTTYLVQTLIDTRQVDTTYPDGTKISQDFYNHPSLYDDGLLHDLTIYDTSGKILQRVTTNWEQGDFDSARVTNVQITDERNQKTTTTYGYNSGVKTNQLSDVTKFGYDGKPLRTIHTDYVTDVNYLRILNLPSAVTTFDSNDQIVALTKFEHDAGGTQKPSNTPGVVNHDDAHNPYAAQYWVPPDDSLDCTDHANQRPTCVHVHNPGYWASDYEPATDYRGNTTKVTRYADAANQANALTESFDYDMDGNVIAQRPNCCELTMFTYGPETEYAFPSSVSHGSPDSPALRNHSASVYDFDTGMPLKSTAVTGLTTTFAYDPVALRPTQITLPTSAAVLYSYDDLNMSTTSTSRDSAYAVADQAVMHLNGLGLIKQVETSAPDGTQNAVAKRYDAVGRLVQQSQPFQLGQQPTLWNQFFYDSMGRITMAQGADNSKVLRYYNEPVQPSLASGNQGQTVRIVDAVGRERWLRRDALDQLAEVVEPAAGGDGTLNWKEGSGNVDTIYQYNGLGHLVKVLQGPKRQERDFQYDSVGRLTAQRLPEKSATLSNSGTYDPKQGVWSDLYTYDQRSNKSSHTDARGVLTAYNYENDPLNRLQNVTYANTSGDNTILPAPAVNYRYMPSGDLTRVFQISPQQSGQGGFGLQTFLYDQFSRIASKTMTFGSSEVPPLQIDYQYDS